MGHHWTNDVDVITDVVNDTDCNSYDNTDINAIPGGNNDARTDDNNDENSNDNTNGNTNDQTDDITDDIIDDSSNDDFYDVLAKCFWLPFCPKSLFLFLKSFFDVLNTRKIEKLRLRLFLLGDKKSQKAMAL